MVSIHRPQEVHGGDWYKKWASVDVGATVIMLQLQFMLYAKDTDKSFSAQIMRVGELLKSYGVIENEKGRLSAFGSGKQTWASSVKK